MSRSRNSLLYAALAAILFFAAAATTVFFVSGVRYVRSVSGVATSSTPVAHATGEGAPSASHLKAPAAVRAIYMSQCAVGTPSLRDNLVNLIDTTALNAVVIDIRDYTGYISFKTDDPVLQPYVSNACGASDMKQFIEELHRKNIYVIGRITVFQNPAYVKAHPDEAVQRKGGGLPAGEAGVWKDYKGLAFVDVGAKPYWDTVVQLGKISYALGFDELNFDYMRFPSDGDMAAADYTWDRGKSKPEALEGFFKYLSENLRPTGAVLSVDLFGMTATNEDDLNIGQVLERAMPYFDYIDPMVYPSHYPSGFNGYKNVNEHSYDIVHAAMKRAVERTVATSTPIASLAFTRLPAGQAGIGTSTPAMYTKPSYPASQMRPWLQSFDYPVTYTPAMVAAQIKANEDAGLQSYLFWDAANKYRSLRSVLAQ